MPTNKHPKLKMAKKMMTAADYRTKTSPFDTPAWNKRKKAIAKRVAKKQNDKKNIHR